MVVAQRSIYNLIGLDMRRVYLQVMLAYVVLSWVPSLAQESPVVASVHDLSRNPRRFDARLVRVQAWLVYGWEGDNFLFDSAKPAPSNTADFKAASVWFYCKPDRERKVWDTIQFRGPPVLGTFTGYFHFVPNRKSRIKDVFDPGPLQLEVIGVSGLASNAKPNTFGPEIPHN